MIVKFRRGLSLLERVRDAASLMSSNRYLALETCWYRQDKIMLCKTKQQQNNNKIRAEQQSERSSRL